MSTEGKEAFNTSIQELKERGYLKITPTRQPDGTLKGWTWEVYEEPNSGLTELPENRISVEPNFGLPGFQLPVRIDNKKDVKQEGITTNKEKPDSIKELFDYWQKAMEYPDLKLTEGRKKHIRARLSDGFTVDQLRAVIDFVKDDPFWRGKNDRNTPYDDIVHIFRNTERVERFLSQISRTKKNNKVVITDEDRAKVKGRWIK